MSAKLRSEQIPYDHKNRIAELKTKLRDAIAVINGKKTKYYEYEKLDADDLKDIDTYLDIAKSRLVEIEVNTQQ